MTSKTHNRLPGSRPLLRALTLASIALLAGCASIPEHIHRVTPAAKLKQRLLEHAEWNTPPIRHSYGSPIVLITPASLPENLAQQRVNIQLNAKATFSDLAAALGAMHLPVLIRSPNLGSTPLSIPYFRGTLGQLLTAVSRVANVFFVWDGSALIAETHAGFTASVPQVKDLAKSIPANLAKIGGTDISVSQQAGTVHFEASTKDIQAIKEYLAGLNSDAALITMRVAIVNVQLDSTHDTGVDWGALEAAVSTAALTGPLSSLVSGLPSSSASSSFSPVPTAPQVTNSTTTTSGTGTSTTTGTGTSTGTSTSVAATAVQNGATLALTGSGAQLTFNAPSFSFSGMLQFLDTYGKTSTLQNMLVRTLGGTTVKLQSGTEVPYVTGVGVGAVGSGSTSSSATVGTADTSTANSGIKLSLSPRYNYRTGQVTISVKLDVDSVLGFNNLSAGSQLGTLTQPTTQKETLTDIVPLLPGQSAVIGGLRYKTISDNRQGLPWLAQNGMASKDLQLNDEEMLIVLRPTITVYDKRIPAGLPAAPIVESNHAMLQVGHD